MNLGLILDRLHPAMQLIVSMPTSDQAGLCLTPKQVAGWDGDQGVGSIPGQPRYGVQRPHIELGSKLICRCL